MNEQKPEAFYLIVKADSEGNILEVVERQRYRTDAVRVLEHYQHYLTQDRDKFRLLKAVEVTPR